MEYRLLYADDPATLEVGVNRYLATGWRCQGGVAVAKAWQLINNFQWAQAVVRDVDPHATNGEAGSETPSPVGGGQG